MFKSGWFRLTVVACATWVLWTLSQRNWGDADVCAEANTIILSALCHVWEFFFPPVLALGLWWASRAFGKDRVEKALSNPKLPTVGSLLLALTLLVLAAHTARLRQEVQTLDSSISEVKTEVESVAGDVHAVGDTVDDVKKSIDTIEMEVQFQRR